MKTNELQQLTSILGTDSLLADTAAAGTGRLTMAQAAAFFGAELVKPSNPVGASLSQKADAVLPEKIALTLFEGWGPSGTGSASESYYYCKTSDGWVTLVLDVSYKEIITGYKEVGVLPAGYRPGSQIYTLGYDHSRLLPMSIIVRADGIILVLPCEFGAEYQIFAGTISFYVGS